MDWLDEMINRTRNKEVIASGLRKEMTFYEGFQRKLEIREEIISDINCRAHQRLYDDLPF